MNPAFRKQQTIARRTHVEGFGYWSGRDVQLEFRPAPPGAGITFVRCDLSPAVRIPAAAAYRQEVPRRTTLCCGGALAEMVEHVMAALAGLRIDNCEVWCSRAEMPGCDGSSQAFVDALLEAGICEQPARREQLVIREPLRVGDERSWVEARPPHGAGMSVCCEIDYRSVPAIGRQSIELPITPDSFQTDLAASRTFLLESEAQWLRSQGLGARTTYQDLLVFDASGPIDNPLRFADECVRHKALDLVGDLGLAGVDLVGHFVAHCSGHRLNVELVNEMLQCWGRRRLQQPA